VVTAADAKPTSPFAFIDYRYFWSMRLAFVMASTMLVVVIGYQVYDLARETMPIREAAFLLGMVGLAQFLPLFLLALPAGYVADRLDRRAIVRTSIAIEALCAATLAGLAAADSMSLTALFVVSVLLGISRAFAGPALSAFAPNIVPASVLPTAIAWGSIAWQTGSVVGPSLGGVLYAGHPSWAYALSAALLALATVLAFLIRRIPRGNAGESHPVRAVIDGLRYVRRNRILFGAISLDLFAVLLGGATAAIPVFARDILHVGAEGAGILRAAPALGAALTAYWLTRHPVARHVGFKMFAGVGVFGLATVVFGLSDLFWLSLVALAVLGAADMVSVYVRSSLIQLHTPDAMRGRVSSVSQLFISASNELGEFETGLTIAWFGPRLAIVLGGVGAMAVTAIWAWRFPELRTADRFEAPKFNSETSPKLSP